VTEGYKYRDLAFQFGGVSNLRQLHMVMSPVEFGAENNCADEDQSRTVEGKPMV
jgi:hypothetical protein